MGIWSSSHEKTSKEDLAWCRIKMKACLDDEKPCAFNRKGCFKKLKEFKEGNEACISN